MIKAEMVAISANSKKIDSIALDSSKDVNFRIKRQELIELVRKKY